MNKQILIAAIEEFINYDPYTGVFTWKKMLSPRAMPGSVAGSQNKAGYLRIGLFGKRYYCHRLAFLICNGYMPVELDHINGDVSDNRINNLRSATSSQNNWNSSRSINNTSGVKGICWDKSREKWKARISIAKGEILQKRTDTIFEAYCFITSKRNQYHKEFSNNG